MTSDKSVKKFSIRWWHWVIIGILFSAGIIISALVYLRQQGIQQYQTYLDDMRKKNVPVSVSEFQLQAPTINEDIQNAWNEWEKDTNSLSLFIYSDKWREYVLGLRKEPDNKYIELEQYGLLMAPAITLLQNKDLTLNHYGWNGKNHTLHVDAESFLANYKSTQLINIHFLSNWLRINSCVSQDANARLQSLENLTRLTEKLMPSISFIDTMILLRALEQRDQAYLDLTILNKLPLALLEAWVKEPSPIAESFANSYDFERALTCYETVEIYNNYSIFIGNNSYTSKFNFSDYFSKKFFYQHPVLYSMGHHDSANIGYMFHNYSERLRNHTGAFSGPLKDNGWTIISKMSCANIAPSAWGISIREADHRALRLSAQIVNFARTNGLPTNETDLTIKLACMDLLKPGGDQLHLRYVRFGTNRFRIAIDPLTPIPNFEDPTKIADKLNLFSAPPSSDPYVLGWGRVEIELQPYHLPPAPQ